ncbi:MAG: hypothetical protein L6264_09880 [Weeksellaceae bacterium]|nr:hypothetical protein [Bacteroidota bacterium]MCG2781248.1 hypothetical protein [Weeksellaceae bacterium]
MKNILFFFLLISSTFLFSQTSGQAIAEGQYKRQVSNAAYEKALNDMQSSVNKSSDEKLKQLNEKFELNFSQKEKFQSKLNSLNQKKIQIESKINQTKSENDKNSLHEKVAVLNSEMEKVNEKLKANENELKSLQESYNKLIK